MVSGSCEQEPKGGKPYNLSQESKRAATIPCFLEKRDIWENQPEVNNNNKTKEMPRASLCLLYPRGKPELKTKLREEGTTPGTGEDNNQSRKMDYFQRTRSTRH